MGDRVGEFAFFLVLGLVLGAMGGAKIVDNQYRQQAIERGYGLYCPLTGDFAWKGECDE